MNTDQNEVTYRRSSPLIRRPIWFSSACWWHSHSRVTRPGRAEYMNAAPLMRVVQIRDDAPVDWTGARPDSDSGSVGFCGAYFHCSWQSYRLPDRMPPDISLSAARYLRARADMDGFNGIIMVSKSRRFPSPPGLRIRAAVCCLKSKANCESLTRVQVSQRCPREWLALTMHHLFTHKAGLPPFLVRTLLDVSGSRGRRPCASAYSLRTRQSMDTDIE